MTLRIVPIGRDPANTFLKAWHRTHKPPQGYRFAIAVADGNTIVGVATVGRPVARALDDGLTVEVTRLATDGTPGACSKLYGASWQTAKAMGYLRAVTYSQDGESGASLRGSNWLPAAHRRARPGWDMPARRRDSSGYAPAERLLWVIESGRPALPTPHMSLPAETQLPDLFTAA